MFKKILATTVLALAVTTSAIAIPPKPPKKSALPYIAYSVVIRDAHGNHISVQSQYNTLRQCLAAAKVIRDTLVEGEATAVQPAEVEVTAYCQAIEVFPTTFG